MCLINNFALTSQIVELALFITYFRKQTMKEGTHANMQIACLQVSNQICSFRGNLAALMCLRPASKCNPGDVSVQAASQTQTQ